MYIYLSLIGISLIVLISSVTTYHNNRQSHQMIMMFPDPESGKVQTIAKYQKTWLDKLKEWLPQAIVAFVFGFLTCAMLFLPG